MLHFGAPLGLIALGALLAPILLHLVRRPLQVVRLGSLRFLGGDRRRLQSWQWQERLLLVLRCLLLTALALLLASPQWQPTRPPPARWLLRLPNATFDGATQTAWDRHRAEGFAVKTLADLSGGRATTESPAGSANDIDLWSRLREADYRLPPQSRVVIFGPPLSSYFRGERPTLSRVEVAWQVTPLGAGKIPVAAEKPRALQAIVLAGPNRAEDAAYVRAMLQAVQADSSSATPDWIFQLGGTPISTALLARVNQGAQLISDASDAEPAAAVSRSFDTELARVHLRQRVAGSAGTPVLIDSMGERLASKMVQGRGRHWQFALRFHPDWSDWPLSSAFPRWWQNQLQPPEPGPIALAADQATPGFNANPLASTPVLRGFGLGDWRHPLWLSALVLFLIERGLSRRAALREGAP